MDEWTIYPSLNNSSHYALGSPDGRELRRGEAVEILLGGFRIPGFIEYSPNGDYFMARTGQSICGLSAGMKLNLNEPVKLKRLARPHVRRTSGLAVMPRKKAWTASMS